MSKNLRNHDALSFENDFQEHALCYFRQIVNSLEDLLASAEGETVNAVDATVCTLVELIREGQAAQAERNAEALALLREIAHTEPGGKNAMRPVTESEIMQLQCPIRPKHSEDDDGTCYGFSCASFEPVLDDDDRGICLLMNGE